MSASTLLILGGGGHAAVVAEAARLAGLDVAGFLDDDARASLFDFPRLGAIDDVEAVASGLDGAGAAWRGHAAVGEPQRRRRWLERLGPRVAPPVVHPSAFVSPSAALAEGVFVGPAAVVHARARVGRGVIVNSGAIVEHDCALGAFCHVAPGAALGGGVTVGEAALVGLNASAAPGAAIGARATLGPGAVWAKREPIPPGATVIGNPARRIASVQATEAPPT